MTRFLRAAAAMFWMVSATCAFAASPTTMTFQGYLTGPGGTPVATPQSITFSLYNVASGGSALWTETQPSVAVAGGVYSVTLGSVTPINLPFDAPYFLGVKVGAEAEMAPRLALASVGYAFRAKTVEDGAVSKSKLSAAGGTAGQLLSTDGTSLAWSAPPATLTPLINPLGNTISTVDSAGSVGSHASITLGADGLPVISYHDSTNGDLKVAKCANAACTGGATITVLDSVGTVGLYTSITLGADGLPVISYYDSTNQDLKVAKCGNAACTGAATITMLDGVGNVGQYTSITLGADARPVMSYYDATNGNLKVAKCANAACTGAATITTVDSAGDVGWDTSITLGADGRPVIGYRDDPNGDLKVAKCADAACTGTATITTVDNSVVGRYPSITLGGDGLPVISYQQIALGRLMVAKCANAACTGAATITAVSNVSFTVDTSSITLGADGLPVISYYELGGLRLNVAKCANAACTEIVAIATADGTQGVGQYNSITLGADGLPVISYQDFINGDLKVVKCSSPTCVPFVRRR